MTEKWTTQNIPDLTGKVSIVTGANSGIGFETAKALAEKGAEVVLACRNLEKANLAAKEIRSKVRKAKLEIIRLDLADLASVKQSANTFKSKHQTLDLLINNAGIMIPPFTKTADGFEVQFGANHLGHFALTGLLMDVILATPGARIVNLSSNAHRMGTGTIDFDNLNAEKGYNAPNAYAQSKLANLLFTLELNRHLVEIGSDVIATAAHPGWTVTGLQKGFLHTVSEWVGQKPEMGALPTLQAALDPDAGRNDYFGPSGFMEMRGYPRKVDTSDAAKDENLARRLWVVSEELTDLSYAWPVLA
jgi:NAD(P)-dependent dehydrogenase (short-subunit alcohol dehydrogenase family)